MADLLTHVLLAYILASVIAYKGFLPHRHVPVAMVGALVPDIAKIHLLLGDSTFQLSGVAFSWYSLQTVGGIVLFLAAAVLVFDPPEQRVAAIVLGLGASAHLLFDLLVERAHGLSPPYFYPLTWWQAPSGDLFISADLWLSVIATTAALLVWYLGRRPAAEG